jgi:hypothetical protein
VIGQKPFGLAATGILLMVDESLRVNKKSHKYCGSSYTDRRVFIL